MRSSRACALLATAVVLAALPDPASTQDQPAQAHEHGVGQLDIVLDGARLEIALSAPGSDIVGFEGSPATAADAAKVKSALATLERPIALFAFEPADACSPNEAARIEAPAAALAPVERAGEAAASTHAHDQHAAHDHDHHHGESSGDHGTWSASYTFDCTSPAALVVNLFDVFPSLQTIRTQVVAPGAQTGAELTPASRRIVLDAAR
jgi:ABC-type nickel/cobalt efflux system permease component RcnA